MSNTTVEGTDAPTPPSEDETGDLRWACGSRMPTLSQQQTSFLCLKVTPTGPNALAPIPTRALCLASTAMAADDGDEYNSQLLDPNVNPRTPLWCYNRVTDITNACSQYLYWSPCQKCGTAWRMFDFVDNDQSYYKFLTPDYDGEGWKFPTTLTNASRNDNAWAGTTTEAWLGWDDRKNLWRNVTMTITPCEDPMKECLVPSTGADVTGDNFNANIDQDMYTEYCMDSAFLNSNMSSNDDGSGGISTGIIVLIALAIGACLGAAFCWFNDCTLKGREGGSADRGGHVHHNHGDMGGGGYGGGGGDGGGDGGGC